MDAQNRSWGFLNMISIWYFYFRKIHQQWIRGNKSIFIGRTESKLIVDIFLTTILNIPEPKT